MKYRRKAKHPGAMRCIAFPLICLASTVQKTASQTPAFSRQVPCPMNPTLTGYVSIANINRDMQDELNRIAAGGAKPTAPYVMTLCPGVVFDAVGNHTLRPLLNDVEFVCGQSGSVAQNCTIDGGNRQVVVADSTVQGYSINSVTFMGITFNGFQGDSSSTITASSPAQVNYNNCIWQVNMSENVVLCDILWFHLSIFSSYGTPQDFNSTNVISLQGKNPGAVHITNSVVQVSS